MGPFHRHFAGAKMPKNVCSKSYVTPRRPFEKERLNQELKIIGEYGLRNKREVWRVKYTLAKIRKASRELLTLDEKDPKRLFEGNALLRRLVRTGVLDESRMKLDYVLSLKVEDFLSVVCKPRSSNWDWPSPSITPVFSSANVTFVSASSWLTSQASSSVWTRRSTSISPSAHPSVAAVLVASRGRTLARDREVMKPKKM